MKKLIITNTFVFIILMIFILSFQCIFSNDNVLIGVFGATALLMLLQTDLSFEPIKNTIMMIILFFAIGLGAYIASDHLFLAIPINFIIVFFIYYKFGYITKAPLFLPFIFLYLFLAPFQITPQQLPLRLISLIVVGIMVMLPQFFINKNKIKKTTEKILPNYVNLLIKKIEILTDAKFEENIEEINRESNKLLDQLKTIIYDKKKSKFYISKESKTSLNLVVALENLNFFIDNVKKDELILLKEKLILLKNNIIKYDKNSLTNLKLKDSNSSKFNIQLKIKIEFAIKSLIEFKEEKSTYSFCFNRKSRENDAYTLTKFKFNPIRLSYSFRMAILITITFFIMEYFHLTQGRWIVYAVLSLTQPYYEKTLTRAKQRFLSTVIATIIISILYSIFTTQISRGIILLFAGYLMSYFRSSYKTSMILITITAIGMALMPSESLTIVGNYGHVNVIIISLLRIGYILIGTVIALLVNKFLFFYNVPKANNKLEETSNNMLKDLFNNLEKIILYNNLDNYVNNSYLLVSSFQKTKIENLQYLNINTNNKELLDIAKNNIALSNSIYFFTNFIKQNKLTNEEQQNLIQFLNNFKNNPKNLKNNLENKNVSDNIKALSYLLLEIYDNAKVSQVI